LALTGSSDNFTSPDSCLDFGSLKTELLNALELSKEKFDEIWLGSESLPADALRLLWSKSLVPSNWSKHSLEWDERDFGMVDAAEVSV